MGVNNAGHVVGVIASFDGSSIISTQPIGNTAGSLQTIPGAPANLIPFAISNNGAIAGSVVASINFFAPAFTSQAITFANGTTTKLPPVASLAESAAVGMSPNGNLVAGFSSDPTFDTITPTIWKGTSPQGLPLPAGFPLGIAFGVNDAGQAVGGAYRMSPSQTMPGATAFWYNGASSVNLGSLPGATGSVATGINNSGWIVGFTNPHSGGLDAITTVPLFQRAVLWVAGSIYDLSTLVDNASGWTFYDAYGINDSGQIVGTGVVNSQQHAFLLTPESGPAITSVVGGGLSNPAVKQLSPNGYFSVFGSGFAAAGETGFLQAGDIVNNTLPTQLGSVCVQAGGQKAALVYYSSTQINALFTAPVTSGNTQVTVLTNCGTANQKATAPFTIPTAPATPEFLFFVHNANGVNPVAAVQADDNSYIGPAGLISGATFAPAKPGDTITIYAVGLGATSPPQTPGTVAAASAIVSNVSVTVANVPATVLYPGVTPGDAGLYQLNIQVPAVPAGNQPIAMTVNGVSSPPGAYLAVAQ